MLNKAGDPSYYDIILMDLQMPVMDGYTATIKIRKMSQFANLPIIAMTADVMSGVKEECLSLGMQDFVTKPINPEEVFQALIKWIDKEKPRIKVPPNEMEHSEILNDVFMPDFKYISPESALRRINNNKELFQNLLRKFYLSNRDFTKQFDIAVEDPNPETALRLIHTLKGVAGNLGANELHKSAATIEKSLREKNENFIELLIGFRVVLSNTLDEIEIYISKIKDSDIEIIFESIADKKLFREPLLELKKLALQQEFNCAKKISEIMKMTQEASNIREFKKIKSLFENFDFELALNEIEKLIPKI